MALETASQTGGLAGAAVNVGFCFCSVCRLLLQGVQA